MFRPLLIATTALVALPAFAQAPATPAQDPWYQDAQAALQDRLARTPNTNRAKNIILFVADGNGVGTNFATRVWVGQQQGGMGEEHVLPHERFAHLGLSKTYNTNSQTPDSAGTATAFMAGVKARAGVIGVDESVIRGDCSGVAAGAVPSIAEILSDQGKAVGIVSTARLTHATPATAYAHAADRNFEDDGDLPAGCAVPDIAAQLLEAMKAGTVDIAMGGGRRHFLPGDVKGEEGKSGKREDGRNLVAEAQAAGIAYVWNDETFAAADLSGGVSGAGVLGLFESSHMKYEHDRTGEPSLAEMTAASIAALASRGGENGYFLQVESGRVDHGNHAGNLHRAVTDGAAFAAAIAKAVEMTSDQDTLIIVTADHDHAITFPGYCGRGTPITGLCMKPSKTGVMHTGEPNLADDGKPYTAVLYGNGPGSVLKEQADGTYSGARPDLTQEEATDPDYLQQALLPMRSETHSPVDVAIYANGPWAHLVDGTVEQNYIFHVMMHAATAE
ncbi:alkaline phosphatase [Rhodovulum sp. DZ06]|uniref:alkaline phosphatase n=1 Tax=Rhodovulum sp. DZ06 TaxID=3425126 RepID=UPI003D339028